MVVLSDTEIHVNNGGNALCSNDVMQKALAIQKIGREALAKKNFDVAVEKSSEALEMVVNSMGEMSTEVAPFYFEYGSTLLDQITSRDDVIGGAIKDAERVQREIVQNEAVQHNDGIDKDDDEKEYEQDDVDNINVHVKEIERESIVGNESIPVDHTQDDIDDGKAEQTTETAPELSDSSADLEVVWEVLETARVIYAKQNDCAGRLGCAKALCRLGDFRLENDDVSGAIEDYTRCLEIREADLSKTNRLIAEVHHALAVAYMNDKNLEKALQHYMATKLVFARLVASIMGHTCTDPHGKQAVENHPEWIDSYKAVNEEYLTKMRADSTVRPEQTEELKEFVEILETIDGQIEDVESNIKDMVTRPDVHSTQAMSDVIQNVMKHVCVNDNSITGTQSTLPINNATPTVNNLGTLVGNKRKQQAKQSKCIDHEDTKKLK